MLLAKFDPVSNRADWIDVVLFDDAVTGELLDLTDSVIVITLNDMDGCHRLTGASQIITTGTVQFTFTRDQMVTLCPGAYSVGATIARGDETSQVVIATVPVMNGLVPR